LLEQVVEDDQAFEEVAAQAVEVVAFHLVQPQRPRHRIQHRLRELQAAPLLQAHIVIHADAGELRQLHAPRLPRLNHLWRRTTRHEGDHVISSVQTTNWRVACGIPVLWGHSPSSVPPVIWASALTMVRPGADLQATVLTSPSATGAQLMVFQLMSRQAVHRVWDVAWKYLLSASLTQ
jgi:hypothetical protein